MKATRRGTAVTASMAATVLVLAACGSDSEEPAAPEGGGETERSGTIVYGEDTAFPENLLPINAAANSVAQANILIRIQPAPFFVMPDFTVVADPDLNASDPVIEETDTGQVVTYEIKEEAVWSDGTPITAADFEYTWRLQRSVDPADGGCADLVGSTGYEQIESVEPGDSDKTAVVTFSSPYPDWQILFTLYPAHLMDAGDDVANCAVVTNGWPVAEGLPEDFSGGPWQLKAENIDAGAQVLTLTPNEMWWGEGPLLESMVYQTIGGESAVQVAGLESGDVQLVSPQPQLDLVDQIKGLEPNIVSQTTFGLSFEHFDFNTANVHLAKPEVRKAFALALNREELVSATVGAFDDRAQLLNNRFYVNNQSQYEDTAPEQYNTQDIAGAKELLESVGYTLGDDGIYEHPQDGRLQVRISTTQANPLREATIDLTTAQVVEAGIAIEKFLDPDIFSGNLDDGNFDIALYAWVVSPFVSGLSDIYLTGGGSNYTGGGNAEADALMEQLKVEIDPDAAAQLANDADRLLWEDLAQLPLYQKPDFTAWSSTFEGIEPNASSAGPVWNSDKYRVVS